MIQGASRAASRLSRKPPARLAADGACTYRPGHDGEAGSKHGDVEAFIERWTARAGGSERANDALFIVELCDLLGVGRPEPAGEETERNAYVFERIVRFRHDDGTTSPGRIDLYKSGCFVLEAKPSRKREKGGEVYEQVAFALETGDREEDERISAPAAFALGALAGDSATPLARSGPYPSSSPMLEPLC